jgi:hypothetical protein
MKLSELLEVLNNLNNTCEGDPDLELRLDDMPLAFERIVCEGTIDVDMERGELTVCPTWDERIMIWVKEIR